MAVLDITPGASCPQRVYFPIIGFQHLSSYSRDVLSRSNVPVPPSSLPPEAPKGWGKTGSEICWIFSALPCLLPSALAKLPAAQQHLP